MKNKKIKTSKRGLTFSLEENESNIGKKYRYIVDMDKKEINIIYDENGNMTVSKKKSGKKIKPLFDLRSKEVKALLSKADYLEIELQKEQIIVHARKKEKAKIVKFLEKRLSLQQLIGREIGQIIVPMAKASGSDWYQYTLEDYFGPILQNNTILKEEQLKETKKIYDVVSLFSGAGLFDRSWLEGNRFRFVYANDFQKEVIETYKKNIGDHIVCKDIREVKEEEIPEADVTIGGPCCQAYSNANRHNINSEEAENKRLLIDDYARLVKSNVWVIENVPTILTKEQGYYFDRLCSKLANYEITATIVTDAEAGGYSQRQRAIIIGSKIGKIELPQVAVVTPKTVKDALSKVDATWFNYEDVTVPSKETERKMSFVPEGGNWRDVPEPYNTYGPKTHSNIMRRLEWNKPAITLTNFRKSNILHPSENRTLTVAEAAAIMGLDKGFKFFGSLAAKQQMVANGVTQAIGKMVKNAVLKKLDLHYAK